MSIPLQSLLQLEAEQKLEELRQEALVYRQLHAAHVAPSRLRHLLALNLLRLAFRQASPQLGPESNG